MDTGCRCPECFGLAEYMLRLTGSDHGLPRAPGHKPPSYSPPKPPAPTVAEQLREVPVQVRERLAPRQPWEPRPARNNRRLQGERPAA